MAEANRKCSSIRCSLETPTSRSTARRPGSGNWRTTARHPLQRWLIGGPRAHVIRRNWTGYFSRSSQQHAQRCAEQTIAIKSLNDARAPGQRPPNQEPGRSSELDPAAHDDHGPTQQNREIVQSRAEAVAVGALARGSRAGGGPAARTPRVAGCGNRCGRYNRANARDRPQTLGAVILL